MLAEMERLLDLGVDGIMTDRPAHPPPGPRIPQRLAHVGPLLTEAHHRRSSVSVAQAPCGEESHDVSGRGVVTASGGRRSRWVTASRRVDGRDDRYRAWSTRRHTLLRTRRRRATAAAGDPLHAGTTAASTASTSRSGTTRPQPQSPADDAGLRDPEPIDQREDLVAVAAPCTGSQPRQERADQCHALHRAWPPPAR